MSLLMLGISGNGGKFAAKRILGTSSRALFRSAIADRGSKLAPKKNLGRRVRCSREGTSCPGQITKAHGIKNELFIKRELEKIITRIRKFVLIDF